MKEIVVVLENVRSALNVGAVFRTCDGAGISKLILGGITPYPPHPKVIKTSIGAEEFVPFEYVKTINSTLTEYRNEGFEIIAIEQTEGSKDFFNAEISDRIVFIFGNELTGVSREILELSDKILELPMKGQKNSLNVATTAGIVLYNTMFSQ